MLCLILFIFSVGHVHTCMQRVVDNGYVCVCNSTYCDKISEVRQLGKGTLKIFYTSASKPGFNEIITSGFSKKKYKINVIKIGLEKHQEVVGFGGAFTDATGINIRRMPITAQEKLMESYFGKDGIGYSLCRVPIGGTDFSLRPYTYDDFDNDVELKHFQLQEEDFEYKIPFMREATLLRNRKPLQFLASAWSAPIWMKTDHIWAGFSILQPKNFQIFTNYIVKFFEEYQKYDIKFWGMTTGNEPMNGFYKTSHAKMNSMGWLPEQQTNWIKQNLGPTLRNSSFNEVKILIHDDDLVSVPYVVPLQLNDPKALRYIDGVATHWYWDKLVNHEVRKMLKSDSKEMITISSESCFFQTSPILGSWDRAQEYLDNIIDVLNDGYQGWIDWNMVLNMTGGPTYINFLADAPVIISDDALEFYKQPMFYAMGHFSKFVVPGSVRMSVDQKHPDSKIVTVAFERPDNVKVLILLNKSDVYTSIQIENESGEYSDEIGISAKSITTINYRD